MNIAFYGSSLVSSYWNGAATYYRGLLQSLATLGCRVVFYEPDVYDRQAHVDIDAPDWATVVVYSPTSQGLSSVLAAAAAADVVIKASGVGVFDDELLTGMLHHTRPDALRIFWDVDAPATLAAIRDTPTHSLRQSLPLLDLVLTYGGGPPVVAAYQALGATECIPVYNALDPATHFPVAADAAYETDLLFLANRLPDRETRVATFFFEPAAALPNHLFSLGGAGWDDRPMPSNIRRLGHVPTAAHNVLNSSARVVLNVARESMAIVGFSPATRIFEAAGAGACLITDAWDGIEMFFRPGHEILIAHNAGDVVRHLANLTPDRARAIGAAAMTRCLRDHLYSQRAAHVHALLTETLAKKRQACAA